MKTKYLLLFTFALLACGMLQEGKAQFAKDSCLFDYYSADGGVNKDSIKIDTCRDSPTFGQEYFKKGFGIRLGEYIFKISPLAIGIRYTDTIIDSKFDSIIRAFDTLQIKYSKINIRRYRYLYYYEDSLFIANPLIVIDFYNYFPYDSVSKDLLKIPVVKMVFTANPPYKNAIQEQTDNKKNFKILPINNFESIKVVGQPQDFADKTYNLKIFNLFGNCIKSDKVFFENNEIEVNVSRLSSGCYFMQIDNIFSKFMIVR